MNVVIFQHKKKDWIFSSEYSSLVLNNSVLTLISITVYYCICTEFYGNRNSLIISKLSLNWIIMLRLYDQTVGYEPKKTTFYFWPYFNGLQNVNAKKEMGLIKLPLVNYASTAQLKRVDYLPLQTCKPNNNTHLK